MLDDQTLSLLVASLIRSATATISTRHVIGIAGIGGSGKSTFASHLLARIRQALPNQPDFAGLIPMDGFHLRNETLDALKLRDRKGSPPTFDAPAYLALLRRCRTDFSQAIPFPIYDRSLHEPVLPGDGEHTITPATRLIITEGNYLLLDEQPWAYLAGEFDECWLLDTPIEQAKDWILARHQRGGRAAQDALFHYQRTDLPNAKLVLDCMRRPDRRLRVCFRVF